ncbi:MAG: pyruvate dehydrogenase complex dihydrolipoamide acetyltransferase [Opitutales bacterium]|nr:pyruvate dehydrogenase complex dihydrolipoamide acetyltransferase [Opitutales bacterium]
MAKIIEMPKLSDTMETGTLARWLKKEGDPVEIGDMLAEVETDKATMELECFEEGILLKQYVPEGAQVPIGGAVCAIGEKGERAPDAGGSDAAPTAEKPAEPEKKQDTKPEPTQTQEKPEKPQETVTDERIKASPLAKKLAAEKGVDLSRLEGSGPNGRIVKKDVLSAAENPPTPAAKTAPAITFASLEDKEIKVSTMRGTIAKRLLESKNTIPHFYLQAELDIGPLLKLRESINAGLAGISAEQGSTKFTVNDFILKAATEALRRVPAANSSWQGDKIVQYGSVHMAFAVAIEEGLVTPTIRNAEAKSLRQISAEAKELIGKARDKKLTPNEMSGSTFTITNLGMYGLDAFFGIINPPNGAILSIGATVKKPVVDANDNIVVGQRMKVGLSCDHRVVDGAVGAQFLAAFKQLIETPSLMLI